MILTNLEFWLVICVSIIIGVWFIWAMDSNNENTDVTFTPVKRRKQPLKYYSGVKCKNCNHVGMEVIKDKKCLMCGSNDWAPIIVTYSYDELVEAKGCC